MGIKHQSVSDPALVKPHEAGERVFRVQHAEHGQFGTITYEVRRLWHFHYQMAKSGFMQLRQHHEDILRRPVDANNERTITSEDDPDITLGVYVAGTQLALNVVLTMQHFCHEMEKSLGLTANQSTLAKRIKETFAEAGLKDPGSDRGYAALREIVDRRDAIEHPKRENTVSSHATDWDQVPLSWFLTERPLRAFLHWQEWFAGSFEEWKANPVHVPKRLTLPVTRGVKSTRQAKKPPKS